MSYTAILATKDEIMLFNREVCSGSFDLNADDWNTTFDLLHSGVEAIILCEINRIDLTSATLAGADYVVMKNGLRLVEVMLMSNLFVWWKQEKAGRVVPIGEVMAYLQDPKCFTQQLKDMAYHFRKPIAGAVDPEDTIDPLTGEVETIEYTWD